MKTSKDTILEPVLMVDGHHGIYSPKIFLEILNAELKKQIPATLRADLRNPEGENYWNAWDQVTQITFKIRNQKLLIEEIEGDIFFVPFCYLRSKEYKENFQY
jgi:hypothetical protein